MKFQLFKLIFKKAKEPEIKLTTFVGLLKKQESSIKKKKKKKIYFCFTDYVKTFDYHHKLWKILKEVGIPDHLTCLFRNLYAGLEAYS